jgi:hypothetical protein
MNARGSGWPPGRVGAALEDLAGAGRVGRVPTDRDYAVAMLERVTESDLRLALLAARLGDWTKANTLTYDAARKSVEALLLAAGWRVRSVHGGHAAVGEVVDGWLREAPGDGPRIAARFAGSRKARHADEYPHPQAPARTDEELRDFALDNVRLVNLCRLELGLPERAEMLPTDANLEAVSL